MLGLFGRKNGAGFQGTAVKSTYHHQTESKKRNLQRENLRCDVLLEPLRPTMFKGRWTGGLVSNGMAFQSELVLCYFVLFQFWDFPDFSRIFPFFFGDFSDLVLFLFLGFLTAPTRNSPERVRDTIRTFPEKSRKPAHLETPWFSFSQHVNRHSVKV